MNEFRVFRALGLGIKAYFKNFIPITILVGVLYAPIVIYMLSAKPFADPDLHNIEEALNRAYIYPLYAMIFASTLIAPMLTYRVIQDLNGQKVSVLTSIKYGFRGIVPAIIIGVVTNVLSLVPMGGIISSVVMCIWFVGAPAAVAERLGPFEALSRSAHLTSGRRWGIFGMLFLIGVVQIGLMAAWIAPMFTSDDVDFASMETSLTVVVVMVGVFYMFTSIVEAVSYALLRQDKDGVSHAELAKVFE
jgi:hypothetical protein